MRIDILTLFPGMFRGPFDESIIKRAVDSGVVSIHIHDIRQWAKGRHKVADDYVYGGGPGMVLKPEPVFEATDAVLAEAPERGPIVLMTPVGRKLDHDLTLELAAESRLIVISGHYEGVDARVHAAPGDTRGEHWRLRSSPAASCRRWSSSIRLCGTSPAHSARRIRPAMSRSPPACSKRLRTPARRSSAA